MLLPLQAFTIPPTLTSIIEPKKQEPPKPITYQVQDQDTLTSIAESQNTTIQRLFNANPSITNPDAIDPSQVLIIPSNTDVLQDRPMPVTLKVLHSSELARSPDSPQGYSYSGNTYFEGQCVWFVKNQLGWVQNGWGNASDWKYTSGHRVSATPVVGSVAWAVGYSHVGIVVGASGDSVTVEEMNYHGAYVVDTRTAPISEFEYILP